ncbi:MAG: class I SAM-dependent methyltransferase [Gammaproteobacteria bacterium]|nr:class I SAM-dependent methyltransferase [Gammaproteobacteria bacterium]MDH3467419.1 class I SAM-dependent methyltransferase [Gammaproteobacteria bacterium]
MSRIGNLIAAWTKSFQDRAKYCTNEKLPFFDIANDYLPISKSAVIIDIGAGLGRFAERLDLRNRYPNLYLLDGNQETVRELAKIYNNVAIYRAPDALPFEHHSVDFVHCSHMIEHLYHEQLYEFLFEIDRVLKPDGILIVSTPLLWAGFYNNLSHVKPYHYAVLTKYLCTKKLQRTGKAISHDYEVMSVTKRYTGDRNEQWGSEIMIVDFMLFVLKHVCGTLRIRKYKESGYTIVLRKGRCQ